MSVLSEFLRSSTTLTIQILRKSPRRWRERIGFYLNRYYIFEVVEVFKILGTKVLFFRNYTKTSISISNKSNSLFVEKYVYRCTTEQKKAVPLPRFSEMTAGSDFLTT